MTLYLGGCSDEIPAIRQASQGFIEGTITGTQLDDGAALNEAFRFTNFAPYEPPTYHLYEEGTVTITIHREDLKTGSHLDLLLVLDDLTDTTPECPTTGMQLFRKRGDVIFYFELDEAITTFNAFTFDAASGRVTGSFSMALPDHANSTQQEATIEGTFDLVVERSYIN